MPRVPLAEETIATRPIGTVFQDTRGATLDAFGGRQARATAALGQGLADVGTAVEGIALAEIEETNKRHAKELDTQYRTEVRNLTFGTGAQGSSGYYGLKGAAAVDARKPTVEELTKIRDRVINSAQNDTVKSMVMPSIDRHTQNTMDGIARFNAGQETAARQTAHQARLEMATEEAGLNHNNPQTITEAKARGIAEIDAFMGPGASKEEKAVVTEQFLTTVNNEVVQAKTFAGDFEGARDYLGRTKNQMNNENFRTQSNEIDRLEKKAQEADRSAQIQAENGLVEKLATGNLSANEILSANVSPATKRIYLNSIAADAEAFETDVPVYQELFARITLPPSDPRAITDERDLDQFMINGNLKPTDFDRLRKEIQNRRTGAGTQAGNWKKTALNVGKSQLTASDPLFGIRDPKGDERNFEYGIALDKALQDGRKNGLTLAEMLDPGSKEYIVPPLINLYKRTPEQVTADIGSSIQRFGQLGITPLNETTAGRLTDGTAPIAERATRQFNGPDGIVYEVDGKFVNEDGSPYVPPKE